jgi:hypothetical protein
MGKNLPDAQRGAITLGAGGKSEYLLKQDKKKIDEKIWQPTSTVAKVTTTGRSSSCRKGFGYE